MSPASPKLIDMAVHLKIIRSNEGLLTQNSELPRFRKFFVTFKIEKQSSPWTNLKTFKFAYVERGKMMAFTFVKLISHHDKTK